MLAPAKAPSAASKQALVAKTRLKDIHIVLADEDPCLSHVVIHNLRAMGFSNITYARTGVEVERALRSKPVSVLVTERHLPDLDGIALVKSVRAGEHSEKRRLPIIMLTGKGEAADVIEARDAGITEFVVKPFSSQTLYGRIEQIVDRPRGFLVSDGYTGPDRRRKGFPPAGEAERRVRAPVVKPSLEEARLPEEMPIWVSPDFALKKTIGGNEPLSRIITPQMVAEAQQSIAAMAQSSLYWITVDLKILEQSYHALAHEYATYHMIKAANAALSIKSRAGVFGYALASEVARLLYVFMSTDFAPSNARHAGIIGAHIDALKVIFARAIKEQDVTGKELVKELQRLAISQK